VNIRINKQKEVWGRTDTRIGHRSVKDSRKFAEGRTRVPSPWQPINSGVMIRPDRKSRGEVKGLGSWVGRVEKDQREQTRTSLRLTERKCQLENLGKEGTVRNKMNTTYRGVRKYRTRGPRHYV